MQYLVVDCHQVKVYLIEDAHIDDNASKPHISKMRNVQETQKTVSKQTRNSVCYFYFSIFYRLCIRILKQAYDTL